MTYLKNLWKVPVDFSFLKFSYISALGSLDTDLGLIKYL